MSKLKNELTDVVRKAVTRELVSDKYRATIYFMSELKRLLSTERARFAAQINLLESEKKKIQTQNDLLQEQLNHITDTSDAHYAYIAVHETDYFDSSICSPAIEIGIWEDNVRMMHDITFVFPYGEKAKLIEFAWTPERAKILNMISYEFDSGDITPSALKNYLNEIGFRNKTKDA